MYRRIAVMLGVAVAAASLVLPHILHRSSTRPASGIRALPALSLRASGPAPGRLLVRYRSGVAASRRDALERSVGAKLVAEVDRVGVRVLHVSPGKLQAVLAKLRRDPSVQFVERDPYAVPTDTLPNDPYFPTGPGALLGGEWGSYTTRAPSAWDMTKGSTSVVVAVVDSGIAAGHPDLASQIVPGYNVLDGSTDTDDSYGHGTQVAGVIAAATDNAAGVAGYCWYCLLMPVKVYDDSNGILYSNMATGITWAADHGARVINVSLGGTAASSTLDAAVSYARDHGAVVVAASGNYGCDCLVYPAASPGALGVAATDQYNVLYSYSDYGSWVALAAPGQNLTTWAIDPFTGNAYGYAPVGGTSMAAPVVAGIAGLMFSLVPTAVPSQVESALETSATPLSGTKTVGYGLVDAYGAIFTLTGPLPTPTPSPSPSSTPTPGPSPSSTPTPSPSSTPSPSPSPSPSSTPSPSPSPSPAMGVTTFNGSLNTKFTSRSYSLSMGSGLADAKLSFSKCSSLTLTLQSGSTTLATGSGSSVLVVDATVSGGAYTYVVSGAGKCSFSLTVTAPV